MDTLEPIAGVAPPPSWPSSGAVSFRNLSVRYAPDLPEVLHKVSFDVEPGMRVGLVGATGSGKSTLALSLFRAIEPHEGKIEIDGLDISTVKLNELRGRLNMVVQDGSLCSGTLREALDITGLKGEPAFGCVHGKVVANEMQMTPRYTKRSAKCISSRLISLQIRICWITRSPTSIRSSLSREATSAMGRGSCSASRGLC